jgi:PQQ-like domain
MQRRFLRTAAAVTAASSTLAFAGGLAPIGALAAAAVVAHAAGPGTQLWASRYNGPGNGDDMGRSVAVAPGGNAVYVTGESLDGASGNDYATVAYNATTGAQLWASRYNGPGNGDDNAVAVAADPRGGSVFVTGTSAGGATQDDYATIAYNATTGAQLWASRYNDPGNGNDQATSMAVSPDGRTVFVTGEGQAGSISVYATIAYNATTGERRWASYYHGPSLGSEAFSIGVSPDGSRVFVTGTSWGGASRFDFATVAYNATTGAQLWASRFNDRTNNSDTALSLAVSPTGNAVYVTGQRTAGIGFRFETAAYNAATGAQKWSRVSTISGDNSASSVAVSPNGGTVFIAGYVQVDTGYDYLTLAYNAATGVQEWEQGYDPGRFGDNSAAAVVVGPGGTTVFVTGRGEPVSEGTSDYGTVAYNAATGAQKWASSYQGPSKSPFDAASSLAINHAGTALFVTGESTGANSKYDYATVAYDTAVASR